MDESRMPDRGRPPGAIGAVANALELLTSLTRSGEIQVNRASRELGISRSTVHRLLVTLTAYGFVEQDPESRVYRSGAVLAALGASSVRGDDLRGVAREPMLRLAAETNETTHLMVLRGDVVVCLDSIESTQAVRTGSRVGWSLPAQSTASGKVLLADLSDHELATIFPRDTIAGPVPTKDVAKIDLLAELEFVRTRGYATNHGESEPDVSAVAVALRDRSGRAQAALSVTAPRTRGDDEWMRDAGIRAVHIVNAVRR